MLARMKNNFYQYYVCFLNSLESAAAFTNWGLAPTIVTTFIMFIIFDITALIFPDDVFGNSLRIQKILLLNLPN